MNLTNCYQILELPMGAGLRQIKSSYRRLARLYHPDVNPHNPTVAQAKFIKISQAYNILMEAIANPAYTPPNIAYSPPTPTVQTKTPPPPPKPPPLSQYEQEMKVKTYQQLQSLLRDRRFARAIALVEGLAMRFPQDVEVRQWQAIAYYAWGCSLLKQKQRHKAIVYLNKARRIDPHNRSLAAEIEEILVR